MKFRICTVSSKMACLVLSLLPVVAWAQLEGAPASSKACLACHQIDTKRVGPPFRGVAQRYAGQTTAMSYLTDKILHGSRGDWGAVPMPAQTQLSEDQAQELVQWVLSLATQQH